MNNPEGWSRISVEYERPNFKVFIYDHAVQDFVHCFSMEVVLDYEGYFVIAASAGDFNPYYTQVESFKLFDPKIFWKNGDTVGRDRSAKAKKEGLSEQINNRVSDLIHTRAVKSGEEIQLFNTTGLMNQVAIQDFYLRPALMKTEELLDTLQSHFNKISDTLRGQQIIDNSTRISTDLFQTYFGLVKIVANETIFLEN